MIYVLNFDFPETANCLILQGPRACLKIGVCFELCRRKPYSLERGLGVCSLMQEIARPNRFGSLAVLECHCSEISNFICSKNR